jgi:predicted metal-dependent peptidase
MPHWWPSVILGDPSHGGRLHPEPRMVRGERKVFTRRYWVRGIEPLESETEPPPEAFAMDPAQARARTEQIVGLAFTRLSSVFPSLSRILPFRKIIYTDRVNTMSVDPYGHLYISPKFVTQTLPQLVAMDYRKRNGRDITEGELARGVRDMVQVILIHEALHIALTHFPRSEEYRRLNQSLIRELESKGIDPHQVFNLVADLEINTIIEEMLKVLRRDGIVSPEANFNMMIHELPECEPHMPFESNYGRLARHLLENAENAPHTGSGSRGSGSESQESRGSSRGSGSESQESRGSSRGSGSESQGSSNIREQIQQSQSGSGGTNAAEGEGMPQDVIGDDMVGSDDELVRETVSRRAAEEGMTPEEYMERERNRVVRESHSAMDEVSQKCGSGAGSGTWSNANRLISSIRGQRRVNWRQVLREFFSSTIGFSKQWRPNILKGRRHPSQLAVGRILLPRVMRRDALRILVLIDASGSIGDIILSNFLGHLQDIAHQMGIGNNVSFTIVPFTTELHTDRAVEVSSDELTSDKVREALAVSGGTEVVGSLQQAAVELVKPSLKGSDNPYSGVLVLTDGETNWGGNWFEWFRRETHHMPLRIGIIEWNYGSLSQKVPVLAKVGFPIPMDQE